MTLLRSVIDNERPAAKPVSAANCPVTAFVRKYLTANQGHYITCAVVNDFYDEVAQTGEFPVLPKSEVFRRLGAAMFNVYGVCKTHALRVDGKYARGFRGVTVCMDEALTATAEVPRQT